ncbi:MAG TPA: diguanylate cyclase [Usitatibacter sp.]|nr:diguanylate cyclase [Usitatibacter sp.]
MKHALALHERVLLSLTGASFITDDERRIVWTNPAFAAVTGYSQAEASGREPGFVCCARHGAERYAALWAAVRRDGHWEGRVWSRRKSGEVFPASMTVSAVQDGRGRVTHYFGVLVDATEQAEAEERMRRLAQYDALTRLPNRTLLEDRLRQALAIASRNGTLLAVLFIDLDRFKAVNDAFGHSAGDAVLRKVASRIEACVRESDSVARWGGDEFVVLLADPHGADAAWRVAQKIRAAVSLPQAFGNREVVVAPSIGIATYPADGIDAAALLEKADAAMYEAKRLGRGTARFQDTQGQPRTRTHDVSPGASTHSGRMRLAAVPGRPSSIGEPT